MLAREIRMTDGRVFSSTVRRGRRARCSSVVVHLRRECQSIQIGLVVSKAVGPAVTRNRVKRQLRHICRDLPLPGGSRLVVRALPRSAILGSRELQADLMCALDKVSHR